MFTPVLLRRFLVTPCMHDGLITLMDVDPSRLEVMHNLAALLIENEGAPVRVESTTDRRAAIAGADVVIISIAVGGMAAWEDDIEIPARHGVFMHIADSIGPGGIFRAFRNLPVIEEICDDVLAAAPNAWVLNYTNPAAAVASVMRDKGVNYASLCSCTGFPMSEDWIAEQLGVDPSTIVMPVPVAGLNHCAGITRVELTDGRDWLELARARATEPVVQWVLDTFGILPYCWAHWVEFFPSLQRLEGSYEGRAQGLEMRYGRRIFVMDEKRELAQKWEDLAQRWALPENRQEATLANLPKGPEDDGIEIVDLMESLFANRGDRLIVNIENNGAIGNLPRDAIVEVPAVIDRYGVTPLLMGDLHPGLALHLERHWATQKATVAAALSGDRVLALEAFRLDPLLDATLEPGAIVALLDEMLAANAQHLARF